MTEQKNKKTVLLIEDNESDIELAKEAFSQIGPRVRLVAVSDGLQSLDYLFKQNGYEEECTPDLILLDLNIPKLDGRGVLEIIKKDLTLHRIPVIVLTGSKEQRDIHHSLDLYANCYIIKPTLGDDFIEMVKQIDLFWLSNKYLSR